MSLNLEMSHLLRTSTWQLTVYEISSLAEILWSLKILKDSGQKRSASPKLSAIMKRRCSTTIIAIMNCISPAAFTGGTCISLARAVIQHHHLSNVEYCSTSGNLTSNSCGKLHCLGVVNDWAWNHDGDRTGDGLVLGPPTTDTRYHSSEATRRKQSSEATRRKHMDIDTI